jgi:hypothetical protein
MWAGKFIGDSDSKVWPVVVGPPVHRAVRLLWMLVAVATQLLLWTSRETTAMILLKAINLLPRPIEDQWKHQLLSS